MMMPPPFKPASRSDSLTDEQQVPHLMQRANSDSVVPEFNNSISSADSPPQPRLLSPTTRLPPALQPLKISSATLKSAAAMIGGQTGPRSVFFTTLTSTDLAKCQ